MSWRVLLLLAWLGIGLWAQTNQFAPSVWATGKLPSLAPGSGAATSAGAGNLLRLSWDQGVALDDYSGEGGGRPDVDWQLGPRVDWWAGGARWQWNLSYAPWWWRFAHEPGRNLFNQILNVGAGWAFSWQDWLRGRLSWLRRDGGEASGGAMALGWGTAGSQISESLQGGRLEWMHAVSPYAWWQLYLAAGNRRYDFLSWKQALPVRNRSREEGWQFSRRLTARWNWLARVFLRQQQEPGSSQLHLLGGWSELSWQPAAGWRLAGFAGPERAQLAENPGGRAMRWLCASGASLEYRRRWQWEARLTQQESSAAGLLAVPGLSRAAALRLGRDAGRNWRWSWQAAVADIRGLNLASPRERFFSAWSGPQIERRLRRGLWLRLQAARLWQRHRGGRRLGLSREHSRLAIGLHYQLPNWGWEQ